MNVSLHGVAALQQNDGIKMQEEKAGEKVEFASRPSLSLSSSNLLRRDI